MASGRCHEQYQRVNTERRMLKPVLITFTFLLFGQAHATPAPVKAAALIAGKPILEKDLEERAAPQLRELNEKVFEIREQVLKDMIDEQLLNQEAGSLKLSVQQLLDREVDSRVIKPTPSDVENHYLEIQERIARPLEEIRAQILGYLTETRRRTAYENYLSSLRSREKVVMLISPPRIFVSIDPARVRGLVKAPITIVEFSDFECPYCGGVEDTLRQLESQYPTQIRLAYRDFPLDFHPSAEPSAEASRCALAQGKYWQYHDLLFANQQHLESSDLLKLAVRLDLDLKIFHACISRKTYKADVQHDVDEGKKLGITGTPAFFINGILVSGAIPLEEFARLIDRELERMKHEKGRPESTP
jgi:predicted DsbA family dithiol-disulfide isomerase